MEAPELISQYKSFGGWQRRYRHFSTSCQCDMHFSLYLPPQTTWGKPLPVLYWLSGLTCNDENFVQKAGAQRYASGMGVIIVCPDTSPRGDDVAEVEEQWDLGQGAGFYVDATQAPWSTHYRMYSYIVEELPALIEANFPVDPQQCGISGHSMGGHGALTLALKNSDRFKSVSAFSPICSPMQCPWGQKALTNYLGNDKQTWLEYDATELLKIATKQLPLLIDQGSADDFLSEQLKPELFKKVSEDVAYPIRLRMQDGYDHSYFFISSFIGEHIEFHAEHLYAND